MYGCIYKEGYNYNREINKETLFVSSKQIKFFSDNFPTIKNK